VELTPVHWSRSLEVPILLQTPCLDSQSQQTTGLLPWIGRVTMRWQYDRALFLPGVWRLNGLHRHLVIAVAVPPAVSRSGSTKNGDHNLRPNRLWRRRDHSRSSRGAQFAGIPLAWRSAVMQHFEVVGAILLCAGEYPSAWQWGHEGAGRWILAEKRWLADFLRDPVVHWWRVVVHSAPEIDCRRGRLWTLACGEGGVAARGRRQNEWAWRPIHRWSKGRTLRQGDRKNPTKQPAIGNQDFFVAP